MFRLKAQASKISLSIDGVNRPFPCCLLPNESLCKTIHMKMSSAYRFIFMQIKPIFLDFPGRLVLKQRNQVTRKMVYCLLLCHFIYKVPLV